MYFSRSGIAHTLEEAIVIAERLGFPSIIRPSFTMGGSGGGIAYNKEEFEEICRRGLDLSPTNELLIDESLIGWKEFEMEVVRDKNDNCIIICAIENFDPMAALGSSMMVEQSPLSVPHSTSMVTWAVQKNSPDWRVYTNSKLPQQDDPSAWPV